MTQIIRIDGHDTRPQKELRKTEAGLLIQDGVVADQAELARLGHVSRARLTQIMNLLNLAPDIQEEVLFLPRTLRGHDAITERDLRQIVGIVDWRIQRKDWRPSRTYRDPALKATACR